MPILFAGVQVFLFGALKMYGRMPTNLQNLRPSVSCKSRFPTVFEGELFQERFPDDGGCLVGLVKVGCSFALGLVVVCFRLI